MEWFKKIFFGLILIFALSFSSCIFVERPFYGCGVVCDKSAYTDWRGAHYFITIDTGRGYTRTYNVTYADFNRARIGEVLCFN